jgi:hypothetical protein
VFNQALETLAIGDASEVETGNHRSRIAASNAATRAAAFAATRSKPGS